VEPDTGGVYGSDPTTSAYAPWLLARRWQAAKTPQITLMDVGTGSITLPNNPAP